MIAQLLAVSAVFRLKINKSNKALALEHNNINRIKHKYVKASLFRNHTGSDEKEEIKYL